MRKKMKRFLGILGGFFFGKDDEIFGKVWRQFLMNKSKRLWRFFFFFFKKILVIIVKGLEHLNSDRLRQSPTTSYQSEFNSI